ncbi:DUF2812 domain-containing protein [Clostridium cellulovorans]|uniref:DUF2812 domain-containing protein n=1 Tax=Clostridium cellulovorans (strain ATCC 35296 / DSM 3052 / OCM 3 / 743B) TaxID=573061 RepID=D9SQN9_CLOC7|nr:DUF2812 domain-containing protein [Clostridium cellulovorans]ADL52245.1 Protein of unknown function DUF2812 [Clostridium cellulovorans 743B]
MKVFKYFIDYSKEEKWLKDMAKKGYKFVNATLGYEFLKTEPEDVIIRIDYRTFNKRKDFIDYCTLFEDSGWNHIAGTQWSGTQYFKRINDYTDDDIFSDSASKAGKYKRVSNMWLSTSVPFIPLLVMNFSNGTIDINKILNPKLLYLTPELWEKKGTNFWFSFLFETPFVILRGFSWAFLLVIVILYIIFAIKAKKLYTEAKRENRSF